MRSETLVLLGASTRAAAHSARRAGFRAVCGDSFADVDLRACCPVTAIKDYPAELEQVADAAPPGAWVYTGGLENYPDLVERIARTRPLLGVGAAELRRVRDPFQLAEALGRAGLAAPECRADPAGLPRDGSWLIKGRRSSGGSQVRIWDIGEADRPRGSHSYFQSRIRGDSQSAVYVAANGQARLLGVTEQLLAAEQPSEGAFRYAGSLGPLPLSEDRRRLFDQIGTVLAREFMLTGLFGVDCIAAGETIWPVEVNPRYTASIEVLERASGLAAIAWHVAACRQNALPPAAPMAAAGRWFGKAILYAASDLQASPEAAEEMLGCPQASDWPAVGDVPAAGARFAAGQPVLTVFADGADRESLLESLSQRQTYWQGRLAGRRGLKG
ncbi:MAG TPA: ATP-grasp domain-containing protein [Pirellulales bacterium]|nr:ATP-grasp domain-containing protein [Pirellulales bacterium]